MRRSGFTIVELLIVIVVIAILAAITIVAYNGVTQSAQVSAAKSEVVNLGQKVKAYEVEHGTLPATLADVDLSDSSGVRTYQNYGNHYCVAVAIDDTTYQVVDGEAPRVGDCVDLAVSVFESSPDYALTYEASTELQGMRSRSMNMQVYGGSMLDGGPVNSYVAIFEWILTPPESGVYTFESRVDDRDMLYVDNQLVLDGSLVGSTEVTTNTAQLTQGESVRVRAIFKDYGGNSVYRLLWQTPSGGSLEYIPSTAINTPPAL